MRIVAVLLLVVALIGCGQKKAETPEAKTPVGVWGQWIDDDGGDGREFDYQYVFSEDGSYSMTVVLQSIEGTWTLSGETVTLDTGTTLTLGDGKTMEGRTSDGEDVVLHRM